MKYQQPYGVSDPEGAYVNGNPTTGTMGSIPPAASIEHPQREIVNFIKDSVRLTPSAADLHQLGKSIQSNQVNYGQDIGTVNTVIVALKPVPDAYYTGMPVTFRAAFGNTGSASLDAGRGAHVVYRAGGTLLLGSEWAPGDLVTVYYDEATGHWLLPAAYGTAGAGPIYLMAPQTYYVNGATGLDTNNGLTAGTAFKTLQRAQNETTKFNLNGFNITIIVADNTYAKVVCNAINGAGNILYVGNVANPGACLINAATGSAFDVNGSRGYSLDGFKVSSAARDAGGTSNGVRVGVGGGCTMLRVDFGQVIDYQCVADGGGFLSYQGPTSISAGASSGSHAAAINGSYLRVGASNAASVLVSASVGFGDSFIRAFANGITYLKFGPLTGAANVISGLKFSAAANGVINTDGGGANYYPGPTPGATGLGGQYV